MGKLLQLNTACAVPFHKGKVQLRENIKCTTESKKTWGTKKSTILNKEAKPMLCKVTIFFFGMHCYALILYAAKRHRET